MTKTILIIFTFSLLSGFVSCTRKSESGSSVDTSAATTNGGSGGGGAASPDASKRLAFPLVTQSELFARLGTALNVATLKEDMGSGNLNTLSTAFANSKDILASRSDNLLTSSTSRAVTNFAWLICDRARTVDTTRVVFKYLDLTKTAPIATNGQKKAQVDAFVRYLGSRFYGRPLNEDEVAVVQKFYEDYSTMTTSISEIQTAVCVVLASSAQTLIKVQ